MHQVGRRLRRLLSGCVDILLRDGACAEELVGDRLLGRLLVRHERVEPGRMRGEDVLHLLLLVGAQIERVQQAASARQEAVAGPAAAATAAAQAVPERGRAAGQDQRERAGREDVLHYGVHHGVFLPLLVAGPSPD